MSIDVGELRRFLTGRRITVCCNSNCFEVTLADVDKYVDRCTIYGSPDLEHGGVTPTIGVEFEKGYEKLAVEGLRLIIDFFKNFNLENSLYIAISRFRFELRIHENAIPRKYLDEFMDKLKLASAIASFTLQNLYNKLIRISFISGGRIRFVDAVSMYGKLVAPYTLLEGSRVVYVKPPAIDSVDIVAGKELVLEHDSMWDHYVEDEAAKLVEAVIESYNKRKLDIDRYRIVASHRVEKPTIPKVVGRFEVMALLQAVRYYLLTGDLEKAKSFGLNRAIFYAYLKYHYHGRARPFRVFPTSARGKEGVVEDREMTKKFASVIGEEVPISSRGWFMMGDQEQLPEDFDRQIRNKFDMVLPFEIVWRAALNYVKKFPESILRNPNKFFRYVYEPVRDSFIERVVIGQDLDKLLSNLLGVFMKEEKVEKQRRRAEGVSPPVKTLTQFFRSDREEKSSGS